MFLRRNPLPPSGHATGPLAGRLAVLMAGVVLAVPAAGLAQQDPAARVLYRLATQCALQGAAPVPCSVEAVDSAGSTLYRHRVGDRVETVRITSEPVTMAIWDRDSRNWRPLRGASARFSTNTVCFNGRDLCVVNPNYLNSVREDRANTRLQGRDLVMVHFGSDGRVDASCYDDACALLLK